MAINPDYAGRTFEPSEPYEVSRVKIAEFASAIGEPSPLCRDRAAAQAAGYPLIATATFAIVVSLPESAKLIADPGLGVNYAMIVHGEQSSPTPARCTRVTWWWPSPPSSRSSRSAT